MSHEIANAHSDTVLGLIVNNATNLLISYSKDCSLKLWSFASSNFPAKSPVDTIYDHESKIRSVDTREFLLGAFDQDGKVTVRDLRNPQEAISTFNIQNVNKFQHICFCDSATLALGNSSAVELYGIDGTFINMLDLHDPIIFMGVQGSQLVAVLETGQFVTIDWQKANKIAEFLFGETFSGEKIASGYLSKTTERFIFGTKSGSIISIY